MAGSARALLGLLLALAAATGPSLAHSCHLQRVLGNAEFAVSCGYESKQLAVAVQCAEGLDDSAWSRFPPEARLDLWSVGSLKFLGCRLPASASLREVVRALNVSFVDTLHLEELRSGLSRRNLAGLSLRVLRIGPAAFRELPADALRDLTDVKDLRVQYTNLTRIPEGFFEGEWSRGLRNVTLIGNRLGRLGPRDLAGLDRAQNLWLSFNEIGAIEAGALDGLPSLRMLDVSGNRLRELPAGLFRRLGGLEAVHLGSNRLERLPADLLTGIDNCRLRRFRMSYNNGSLATLPDGFFRGLGSLTFVELVHDGFTSLPGDLLAGASALERLDLSENNLTTLPAELLRDARKLVELRVIGSQLEQLPKGVFASLISLERLYLNQNRLTAISSDMLEGIDNLKILEAAWNNISYIDPSFCEYIKEVTKIELTGNQLTLEGTAGMSVLLNCLHLKELRVSHNKVPRIYGDWIFLTIDLIDLQYNEITEFGTLQLDHIHLETTLFLQNNKISTIDLRGLENLTEVYRSGNPQSPNKALKVYLGNNPLNCDCRLTDFFRYFENKMNRNVRDYVEIYADLVDGKRNVEFDGFKCASPEEFASRNIADIRSEDLNCLVESNSKEDACSNLCFCREYPEKHELSVDCSNKNLTKLPSFIVNPHGWAIHLNMSGNKLSQTPCLNCTSQSTSNGSKSQDSYLSSVTSLDLSGNNISSVTLDVFSRRLEDLRLHNNSISRLEQRVIDYLSGDDVPKLTLHANRWECNCQARNFLSWVQRKLKTHELHEIMCYGTTRRLSTMTVNELCEGAIAIIVGASLLIAFFGVVIGSLAALYYRYQKEIKIWLYAKQWCLWFVTEDELDRDKKYDAFISFSHKDEDFVEKEIVAKLEEGPRPYKLCLHYRDWLAGEWIPEQIARSVEESRRTVVILSPNFLQSIWGRMEFRTAHTRALQEGRARLIVVLYGELGNVDELDPELKSYLSLNTYVKWGDPWFWDKLRYALPHRYEPAKRKTRNARIIENHLAQLPVNNGNATGGGGGGKAEVIPMPKLITSTNDSVKLLDSGAEDERMVASC